MLDVGAGFSIPFSVSLSKEIKIEKSERRE
jgi:hypothetical protein